MRVESCEVINGNPDSGQCRRRPRRCVGSHLLRTLQEICILALTVASVLSIPVESTSGTKGLDRPSPINPDVVSDPKPQVVSASSPELPPPAAESHIQKVPAKGAKLSSEVDKHHKQTHEAPKTSDAHETTKKVKRQVESSGTTTTVRSTNTTRAPVVSSADENDNSPPHFIRPVPVDQILKNIHDAPKHHEPSQVVSLHDHVTPSAPTTAAPASADDSEDDEPVKRTGNHKLNHAYKKKKDEDKSSEEGKSSEEDDKDQ